MFTPEERSRVRSGLLDHAAGDRRISGAAITGSAAAAREDRWSDIDLAFGVGNAGELPKVLADWTAHMYHRHLALHHLDVQGRRVDLPRVSSPIHFAGGSRLCARDGIPSLGANLPTYVRESE